MPRKIVKINYQKLESASSYNYIFMYVENKLLMLLYVEYHCTIHTILLCNVLLSSSLPLNNYYYHAPLCSWIKNFLKLFFKYKKNVEKILKNKLYHIHYHMEKIKLTLKIKLKKGFLEFQDLNICHTNHI